MKNRSTIEGRNPGPCPTEAHSSPTLWYGLPVGFVLAAAILVAPLAGAEEAAGEQEAERITREGAPESRGTAPDTRASSGIEMIFVRGGEADGTSDYEAADSVTGFGAEDLAALGAQSIADIASFTPNLEIVTYGATSPTFFIRGVGLNDFNSNSTGAVAIYQDDVARNAPALQLSTLFDVEAVNVLRGPQGTGLARNASAGAIKIYSRKPSGDFGGYLRSDFGNFNFRDFEGAIETPFVEDLLSGRFAFRFTERDGTMKNRCANAPAFEDRELLPGGLLAKGKKKTDAPWSICGETVERKGIAGFSRISDIPMDLPSSVNNTNNWAVRGTLLFQPTLDMSWLLNAHGSRRDEWSRLGQSIGTGGFYCADGDVFHCFSGDEDDDGNPDASANIPGLLGGRQGSGSDYRAREIQRRLEELSPCNIAFPDNPNGNCETLANRAADNAAKIQLAEELARNLDPQPWVGDFNLCGSRVSPDGVFTDRDASGTRCKKNKGKTLNDTFGFYLNGDVVLPLGIQLTSVSSYDAYDRLLDLDLDFSPETLFEIVTDDEGWQVTQDLRLQGLFRDDTGMRWDIGGWFLREQLDVLVINDLGNVGIFAVGRRKYTQDLWSVAGYASLAFDFGDNFTLDGGFRYNWENKKLDYTLTQTAIGEIVEKLDESWSAPTGTLRLTYRFREDTHAFWKYTRGWKPGTFNATSSFASGVSVANPETIDSFETGLRGSWFDGRAGLDLSFFYYNYQDYQLFTAQQFSGGQPEFVILNAESAEVYGAEIDAVFRPWSGAFGNIRFGWLESQFLNYVQLQQEIIVEGGAQVTVDRELQNTGNPLLNSPRFKVSLTGEQTFPLGRWGSVTARYDGVWTDVNFYDATAGRGLPNVNNTLFLPNETIAQPSFWLHNLRFSYLAPGGRFEFAGWVRNITNKAYKTFAFDGSTFNNTSIYFVGDPRTYGVTLQFNF